MRSIPRALIALAALAVLAAACGGGTATPPPPPPADDVAAADPTDEQTTEDEPTEEEPTEPVEEETSEEEPTEEETTEPVEEETTEEEPFGTLPTGEPATLPTLEPPASDPGTDFSFGEEMDAPEMSVPSDDAPYSGYTFITDDTVSIGVEVPVEWTDIDGAPFTDDAGRQFFDVRAASDLNSFLTTWDTPGIIVTASSDAAATQNEISFLDAIQPGFAGQCTYDGRFPFDDGLYNGQFDVFTECGGTGAEYLVLAAVPTSRAFVIVVQIQVNGERDLEALDRALATFVFDPA